MKKIIAFLVLNLAFLPIYAATGQTSEITAVQAVSLLGVVYEVAASVIPTKKNHTISKKIAQVITLVGDIFHSVSDRLNNKKK